MLTIADLSTVRNVDDFCHVCCKFFFIFKHLRAPKRSLKIFHGVLEKSWIFLSVKEWEPCFVCASQLEHQKWNKDPLKNTCDSYLNARKEVGILLSLQHDHIVPLLALCLDPLSLVLQLAPQGSLSDRLKEYLRAGDRLSTRVIRDVIVQVS